MTDFGLATYINQATTDFSAGCQSDVVQRTTKKGTEHYMSPEQVNYLHDVVMMMMGNKMCSCLKGKIRHTSFPVTSP